MKELPKILWKGSKNKFLFPSTLFKLQIMIWAVEKREKIDFENTFNSFQYVFFIIIIFLIAYISRPIIKELKTKKYH